MSLSSPRRQGPITTAGRKVTTIVLHRLAAAYGVRLRGRQWRGRSYLPPPHRALLAICAPSLNDLSLAQTMLGWTSFEPAKVAKPQSEPAITFSRPTTLA